jgi:predicted metal-binding membrane protein
VLTGLDAVVGMAVMSATMLPSAVPLLRLDAATSGSAGHTAAVALGYAGVWALLGTAAMPLAMLGLPSHASAAALGGAAVYQVSPVARRCLTRCRAPLARMVVGWSEGFTGGLWMGVRNGIWCAGCCAGLLVGLIVVGAASIWAMLVFGALAAVQKVAPFGVEASFVYAIALAAGAALVLL